MRNSSPVSRPHGFHIRPIDGVRGIAALGVVAFHLRPSYLFWLWLMVDLFFVISGLVITLQLLAPAELRAASLRAFWVRRALRIFPLYYFSLALAVGIEWLFLKLDLIGGGFHERLWPYFFFLQFTELYAAGSELVATGFPRYFLPSWSLASEEQFYLIWPLLLFALRRRTGALLLICCMLIAAGLLARLADYSIYLLLSRVDGLAAGSLLALILHRAALPQGGQASASSVIETKGFCICLAVLGGILCAPLIFLGYRSISPKPDVVSAYADIGVTGFVLMCTVMLAWVAREPGSSLGRFLSHPAMTYFGSISFSVYMLHMPLRGVYDVLLSVQQIDRSGLTDACYVAGVIAAAHLSRNMIERPFERLKHRYPLELPMATAKEGAAISSRDPEVACRP